MRDLNERLRAGLTPAQQEKLGDLTEVTQQLAHYDAPEPEAADHARLLAALDSALAPATASQPVATTAPPSQGIQAWLRLAWSQAALIEAPFWWASGIVFMIGLALIMLGRDGILAMALVFLAPVLSATGVAYAFRPETRTLWELERLTPVRPLALLYARLALVVTLEALLALALLMVLWAQGPQLVLWRLLLIWLGPMLALVGTALYTTLRWGPVAGAGLPLGLWGALMLTGWRQAVEAATPSLSAADWLVIQVNGSNALLGLCLVTALAGAYLLHAAGRLAIQERGAWC